MESVYILRGINLQKKSLNDLEKEFEHFKINHPIWLNKTYDEFIYFLKSWKNDKYSFSYDDNAYCESYCNAYKKVINNSCDINDGGVYNYIAILKIPSNTCYATTYITEKDINLFKFDKNNNVYFEVYKEDNEEVQWLIDRVRGVVGL